MLQLLWNYLDIQLIMEIMEGAPKFWSIYFDPSRIQTIGELQDTIKVHEGELYNNPTTANHDLERRIKALEHMKSS